MSTNNQDPPITFSGGNTLLSLNNQDPPITISGGSVTIAFSSKIFTKDGEDKYTNSDKQIENIVVAIEGKDPQTIEVPDGKVTVTINYIDSKT